MITESDSSQLLVGTNNSFCIETKGCQSRRMLDKTWFFRNLFALRDPLCKVRSFQCALHHQQSCLSVSSRHDTVSLSFAGLAMSVRKCLFDPFANDSRNLSWQDLQRACDASEGLPREGAVFLIDHSWSFDNAKTALSSLQEVPREHLFDRLAALTVPTANSAETLRSLPEYTYCVTPFYRA